MPPRAPFLTVLLILLVTSPMSAQNKEFADRYRALMEEVEANPDDQILRLEAAYWAGVSRQPREALKVLETIEPTTLPDSSGIGPASHLYWLYLTSFWNMLGEHERELAGAREYAELFPDGYWRGYLSIRALASLGRVDEVNQLIDAWATISPDHLDVLLDCGARFLRDHGYSEAADDLRAREVAWYEARPLTTDDGKDYRVDLAAALYKSARWQEAKTIFLELAEEDPESRGARAYLGLLAARSGDEEEAAATDAWLADREVSEGGAGVDTIYRARIAAAQGDIERAVALLEQALAEGYRRPAELRSYIVRDFEPYLGHRAYRDFLRPSE